MSYNDPQQSYGPVLYHYDLFAEKVEHYGKVKKIYSNRGVFALKETSCTAQDMEWLIHCYERLASLGYRNIPPIYRTKFGDPVMQAGGKFYYLMPWYSDVQPESYEKEEFLMEEMGKFHALTVKEQVFASDVIVESYSALVNRFETRQLQMEQFTESSERSTYVAPFELNYLTNFHRMMRMAEESKKLVGEWYRQCDAAQRFRSVLCHGRPLRNHVVFTESGEKLLINFERAVLDTPVRDLAIFFRGVTNYMDWNVEDGLYWLECYERHFRLYPEEKVLLASYLYFPEPVFVLVEQYKRNRRDYSQLDFVRRFEVKLRTIKKLRALADRIIEQG